MAVRLALEVPAPEVLPSRELGRARHSSGFGVPRKIARQRCELQAIGVLGVGRAAEILLEDASAGGIPSGGFRWPMRARWTGPSGES